MGYLKAINRHIEKGEWSPLLHQEFVRNLGVFHKGSEERFSLLVFKKEESRMKPRTTIRF